MRGIVAVYFRSSALHQGWKYFSCAAKSNLISSNSFTRHRLEVNIISLIELRGGLIINIVGVDALKSELVALKRNIFDLVGGHPMFTSISANFLCSD